MTEREIVLGQLNTLVAKLPIEEIRLLILIYEEHLACLVVKPCLRFVDYASEAERAT